MMLHATRCREFALYTFEKLGYLQNYGYYIRQKRRRVGLARLFILRLDASIEIRHFIMQLNSDFLHILPVSEYEYVYTVRFDTEILHILVSRR